jgi:hypothetical protein
VPILVATRADNVRLDLKWAPDGVAKPLLSNGGNLGTLLCTVLAKTPKQDAFDPEQWAVSGYKPTPTIIEAAQALYQGHRVEEITRSEAGAKNLSETTICLENIIEEAKPKHQKTICFVTGVPGAGKTLAGLNLVTHRTKAHEEEHAVFLSGNGPLVDVLREALARDEQAQAKERGQTIAKAEAARKVKTFIRTFITFAMQIYKTQRPQSNGLPCSMKRSVPGTKTRLLTLWPSASASRILINPNRSS